MSKKKKPAVEPSGIRDRIKELRRVRAGDLHANPKNWRLHPPAQRAALEGLLAEVGYADALLARELPDGSLELVDGHLRAETTPDMVVPVLVLDVSEAEADKILSTLDPLAAMAEIDAERLESLLNEVQTGSEDVAALLDGLAQEAGIVEPPEADKKSRAVDEIEESFAVLVKCGSESDQKEILRELDSHGLEVRALCTGFPVVAPAEIDETPLRAGEHKIRVESKINRTARVIQLEGIFDVPRASEISKEWRVDLALDKPWSIGLIVGPSGSGKSTIARELFGDKLVAGWDWPHDAALIDGFPAGLSINEITAMLSSVGFSSPPSWIKPFAVLSNGEQFRVNLARTLAEMPGLAVVDEFTSVVDRTVAQVGSAAVAKAIRATNRKFVAVTCHYDVEEWLQPDWKYDTSRNEFAWRSLRRRPEIQLQIQRVDRSAWQVFKGHHYLNSNLHAAAQCFLGTVSGQPAAFVGVLWNAHPISGGWWRESRCVCLPDFQGVGIGSRMSDYVASLFAALGKPYRSTSSHPAVLRHRLRSDNWMMIRGPSLASNSGSAKMKKHLATTRMTAGFEWIGPKAREDAAAFGLDITEAA